MNCRINLLTKNFENNVWEIVDGISQFLPKAGKRSSTRLAGIEKFKKVISLIVGIFKKDMTIIFTELSELKDVIGIENDASIEIFESFTLLLNNQASSITKEKLMKAIYIFSNWVLSLLKFNDGIDSESMRQKIQGMIKATFGAIYWQTGTELFFEGAAAINEKLGFVIHLVNNLQKIRMLKSEDLIKLLRLEEGPGNKILISIMSVLSLIFTKIAEYTSFLTPPENADKNDKKVSKKFHIF
jgi:hypothetical protein